MKKQYSHLLPRRDRLAMAGLFSCLLAWEGIKYILPRNHQREYVFQQLHQTNKDTQDLDSSILINIEEATLDELTIIGFPERLGQRILNYQSKGGVITSKEELLDIYGMDSLILMKVGPHLEYSQIKRKKFNFSKTDKPTLDINTATIVEWEGLPMIGLTLAERIVKFRTKLGGFISIDQVGTCYGIQPETMEIIRPYLSIKGSIKKIDLNKTDLDSLYHPYLSSKILKIAEAYKRQHGPFASIEELKKVYPADTTWYVKSLPYLSVN